MAGKINSFDYSKVRGRGRGVLGLKKFSGLNNSSEKGKFWGINKKPTVSGLWLIVALCQQMKLQR